MREAEQHTCRGCILSGVRGPEWHSSGMYTDKSGKRKRFGLYIAALTMLAAADATGAAAPVSVRTGLYLTSFNQTTPLADIGEVLRRTLPAPTYDSYLAKNDLPTGQVINPADEQWQVYVPENYDGNKPYGVLVWVAPQDALEFPAGWRGILDRQRVIYVSAAKSGNDQEVRQRRIPLALTGLENILARYRIDPRRIYVGGFSGGGRVASLIASAYADLFTGGIFVANSFGLGSDDLPVPSLRRLKLMQNRGRYMFLAGTEDSVGALITSRAVALDRQLCVLNVKLVQMWNKGHVDASADYLHQALDYLDSSSGVSGATQADCEQQLAARRGAAIAAARAALVSGQTDEARKDLLDLYREFGPLSEPEFDKLWACLADAKSAHGCAGSNTSGS